MEKLQLTAVFVQGEYGYTAYLEELRGVITQGKSIKEAEENLYDALELYLKPDSSDSYHVDDMGKFLITTKPFISMTKMA